MDLVRSVGSYLTALFTSTLGIAMLVLDVTGLAVLLWNTGYTGPDAPPIPDAAIWVGILACFIIANFDLYRRREAELAAFRLKEANERPNIRFAVKEVSPEVGFDYGDPIKPDDYNVAIHVRLVGQNYGETESEAEIAVDVVNTTLPPFLDFPANLVSSKRAVRWLHTPGGVPYDAPIVFNKTPITFRHSVYLTIVEEMEKVATFLKESENHELHLRYRPATPMWQEEEWQHLKLTLPISTWRDAFVSNWKSNPRAKHLTEIALANASTE
jgi:hypothetical protein